MKEGNNNLAVAIVIGLAIVVSMYLYSNSLNVATNKKIESRKQENTERITNIKDCLEKQQVKYSVGWDSQCKVYNKDSGCVLNASEYSSVEESYKENKAMCLSIYNYGGLSF